MGLNYGYKYTCARGNKSIPAIPINKLAIDIYDANTLLILYSFDSVTKASDGTTFTKARISYYAKKNRGKDINECVTYKDYIITYNIKNVI
jgi:hypothetical protein